MLDIIFALLVGLITGEPSGDWIMDEQAELLAAHVLKVCPGCSHGPLLAESILTEAMARGLDPALMAAVAWTESGYQRGVTGKYGSIGLWQLYPGHWLAEPWDEIRIGPREVRPPWGRLSRRAREVLLRDVLVSTYMAGWVMAYHLERCAEGGPACYARYQTGRARVSPRYRGVIAHRARVVRERLRPW